MSTLTKMARELLTIDDDLPFRLKSYSHIRVDDFELYTFEQAWADTTCGFGGIGGQAITTARTYVFVPVNVDEKCYVYIGGRFAYSCEWSETFKKDLMNQNVAGKIYAGKYAVKKGDDKMKPVFKCDYCNFIGTQEEVEKHEPTCFDNYDRKSCYTCEYKIFKNLKQFSCTYGKEILEGKLIEFCPEYKRKEKSDSPFGDVISGLFGGF